MKLDIYNGSKGWDHDQSPARAMLKRKFKYFHHAFNMHNFIHLGIFIEIHITEIHTASMYIHDFWPQLL